MVTHSYYSFTIQDSTSSFSDKSLLLCDFLQVFLFHIIRKLLFCGQSSDPNILNLQNLLKSQITPLQKQTKN